jgi:hypothetical protein
VEGRVHSPDLIEEPVVTMSFALPARRGSVAKYAGFIHPDLAGRILFCARRAAAHVKFSPTDATAGTPGKNQAPTTAHEAIKSAVKKDWEWPYSADRHNGELSQGL